MPGVMMYRKQDGTVVPIAKGGVGDPGPTGPKGDRGDDRVKVVTTKPANATGYNEGDIIVVAP